jgi:phosphate starvation-inducible membrane PsiE
MQLFEINIFVIVIQFVKLNHVVLVSSQVSFNNMIDLILFYYFYNEFIGKLCTFQ